MCHPRFLIIKFVFIEILNKLPYPWIFVETKCILPLATLNFATVFSASFHWKTVLIVCECAASLQIIVWIRCCSIVIKSYLANKWETEFIKLWVPVQFTVHCPIPPFKICSIPKIRFCIRFPFKTTPPFLQEKNYLMWEKTCRIEICLLI